MTAEGQERHEDAARGGTGGAPRRVPTPALLGTFLRSFLIQGSWNYRTMIGHGFGFAMLPVLRSLFRGHELQDALDRHTDHFNAHPYLAGVGLGAASRMEADGDDPEGIRRFKDVLRGPLGGLGDGLVWAGLLPVAMLAALVLAWLGAGPEVCVPAFLVLYNAGHLALRVWGFRAGLREGRAIGARLRDAGLRTKTGVLARAGSFLTGLLLALILWAPGEGIAAPLWWLLVVAAVGVGLSGGERVWRPAALVVVGAVGATVLIDMLLSAA